MIGPTATPPVNTALHVATACARCAGSTKRWRTKASVDGMSVAPPTASSARAAMSIPGDTENAAATDAVLNAIAPIMSSRR